MRRARVVAQENDRKLIRAHLVITKQQLGAQTMKYRRTYTMLVNYGFSGAKALEIVLDAGRRSSKKHAMSIIRVVRKAHQCL